MISQALDEDTDIIHVVGRGIWSRSDVEIHYSRLRTLISSIRSRGRSIRLLSDVRGAPRQNPDIEAYIRWQMRRTFDTSDQVAVVTAHNLVGLASRQFPEFLLVMFFSEVGDAKLWLSCR